MRIIQTNKDGSTEIIFEDNEIQLINKNKKLFLNAVSMKSFVNHLVHIAVQFNLNLKDQKDQLSTPGEKIKTE